jgi:3-hydroxyacyl-CoA dehydrogenase
MNIEKVGVIGCGLMGHGIVQVAAQGGFRVVGYEMDSGALDAGMQRIEKSLAKLADKAVEKGKKSREDADSDAAAARGRITATLEIGDLLDCDLVIEAIVENLEIKKSLFAQLGSQCKPGTILASNTSSFPIGELAAASGRADRTIGLHFFNPVQLMRLVEVIQTESTDAEVFAAAREFGTACGKHSVACRDTPGFVVNRLLVPYMCEALQMLDRGDASKEDIDAAMQFGCGHPMGPITLTDYVGLDTTLSILEGWCERYPDEPAFQVPASLRERVEAGKFGRKTGEGYYRWDGDKRV